MNFVIVEENLDAAITINTSGTCCWLAGSTGDVRA